MDVIYAKLIQAGLREIDQVQPEDLRGRVQLILDKDEKK